MSIKLRLPTVDPEHVVAGVSPMSEAIASLHVLLHPWAHPLQHPWVREMRSLPADLKRDVRAWGFVYDGAAPDCFLPPDTHSELTYEESVDLLEAMEPELATYELVRPFFFYAKPASGGAESLQDPEVHAFIRMRVDRNFPECRELLELALGDPQELQCRAVAFLRRYWRESFAETWSDLEPRLRAEVDQLREEVGGGKLFERLEPFRAELRSDASTGVLERPSLHEHEVEVTPASPLLLLPSAYVWPHVRVNCDEPYPLALIFPASFVAADARRTPAPEPLVAALRAAGDPVRLQVLRLVTQRPRTTEELAPLVGLSISGLSKHLRALTDAQLVTSNRDGWYVLYSADRDRLAALSGELLDYLAE